MTFLSYAQNCEDVLLWRALGHIKNGFYIDVGANDPLEHSVTKAFYDAGWSGINIEPLPSYHDKFLEQRPKDINLAIAAGEDDGSLTLFDVPSIQGWASPEQAVADAHRAEGYEVVELTVPVRTLAGVCAEHALAEIHFLKVDVEGFEGAVLRGMDFETYRPWVLVIEATLPNSRECNHEAWENLVTSQRYLYAHFDGLNRYYVAEEHAELVPVLSVQPNVFDDFISYHLDRAWKANERAKLALAEAEQHAVDMREHAAHREALASAALLKAHNEIAGLNTKLHTVSSWAGDLESRLLATLASTSWRVTAPLRKLGAARIQARQQVAATRQRFAHLTLRLTSNERLRRLLIPVLLRFPKLATRISDTLRTVRTPAASGVAQAGPPVAEALRSLPASARKVLGDIERARSHTRDQ